MTKTPRTVNRNRNVDRIDLSIVVKSDSVFRSKFVTSTLVSEVHFALKSTAKNRKLTKRLDVLNAHEKYGTRITAKTQSVATGTSHKLKLGESAENSQREWHRLHGAT
jgi:2-oxo-4-hydroxy-4-carboxy--5-ureidoimidazoline (OHCU) decarboxylase